MVGPDCSHGSRTGWTVLQNTARMVGTNEGTRTGYLTFCRVFAAICENMTTRAAEVYRVSMGRQPAIGQVSMATWANLLQRAREGWLDAVRTVLPEPAARKW